MTPEMLIAIRYSWGWSQSIMANQLGLSLRAYQEIESGRAAIREMMILALERISLATAVCDCKKERLMEGVRADIEALSQLK